MGIQHNARGPGSPFGGRVALLAALAAAALTLTLPAGPASAGQDSARICRERTTLRYSPGGARIGELHRRDRVIIVAYARRHGWAYVISRAGQGWVVTAALCKRR